MDMNHYQTGKPSGSQKVKALTDPTFNLTDQQKIFVDQIMKGTSAMHAARAAGYSDPQANAYRVLNSPNIQQAIRYLHKKHEKKADMTRKKVMDGFLEAIEMAKIQAEPSVMVNGWREVGRMCGYYAPETKKIDINITAKRVIDKLETLSDSELAEMIEESANVIEGEASEVLNLLQAADDAGYAANPELPPLDDDDEDAPEQNG